MTESPSSPSPPTVEDRLAQVKADIAKSATEAGRRPESVTLVAVSKTFSAEEVEPVLAAGQRTFGENRVQEAQGKWPDLKVRYPDIELHLIGPLQTNKAREAVALFDVIETVDRPKLAKVLAEEMARQGRRLPIYIQVNTGEEAQKAGVLPGEADAFIGECRDVLGLDVRGLMCIPPVGEEAAPHFAFLREIARRNGLTVLSMGMSGDFPIAVTLGATHVRVGSAIFGVRL